MNELAQHPGCVVKYSGLDPIDGEVAAYRPYVEYLFEKFGPERIMWASNWPATRLGGSYQLIVEDSLGLLPELTSDERELVFDGTARRVYRMLASTESEGVS
jgi:L-fuconolactonase